MSSCNPESLLELQKASAIKDDKHFISALPSSLLPLKAIDQPMKLQIKSPL